MTAKALKAAARTANRELGSANYGATDVSTTGIADTIHRAKAIARAARAAAEVAQQQVPRARHLGSCAQRWHLTMRTPT